MRKIGETSQWTCAIINDQKEGQVIHCNTKGKHNATATLKNRDVAGDKDINIETEKMSFQIDSKKSNLEMKHVDR